MVKKLKLKKSLNNFNCREQLRIVVVPFFYNLLYTDKRVCKFLLKRKKNDMARRSGLNFNKKRRKIESAVLKEILSWSIGVFVAIMLAFVIVYCVGMTTSVIGISMKPTLENGEKIMVNRFVYMVSSPKQNDVIVFVPNGSLNSHYYVKRVVGTPGDTVQIIDGHLYINEELFEFEEEYDEMAHAGIAENKITLKKGEYFVLGDNRNASEDSRSANIGIINKKNIVGKAWLHLGGGQNTIGFVK